MCPGDRPAVRLIGVVAAERRTDVDDRRPRWELHGGHDVANRAAAVRCGAHRCRSDVAHRVHRAEDHRASVRCSGLCRLSSRCRRNAQRVAPLKDHRASADRWRRRLDVVGHSRSCRFEALASPAEDPIVADVRNLMGVGRSA